MPWSPVISSDDVVAIHAVLVPTGNGDGEILLFGGDDHDRAANIAHRWDHSRRFNCREPTRPLVHVQSPNVDLFCCGHAYLGDGRVLVAGGTITFPPESEGIHAHLHFEGHRHAFIYRPGDTAFMEVPSMGHQPGRQTGGGRWYPSLCTVSTGEVLAVAGHPAGDDTRHNNNRPERYEPGGNRWVVLPATGPDSAPGPDLFPRLHVLRDGSMFVSSALQGNTRCIAIDPSSGHKREVIDLPDGAYRGFDCPSVLLPLTPGDGYHPRVLLCGGVISQMADLGQAAPTWVAVPRSGSAAGRGRTHASATILPTGDVLLTGGADPANDQSGVMTPELYSLPTDHAVGTPSYSGGPGHWSTVNEPATVLRNYHSTALLMPDGRVWTAGGNSPNQPEMPPTERQKQIEIFEPPYPAGARPRISHCPRFVGYGEHFEVQTPQARQIHAVTLLRCGSSTHAFNPDQRCIFLSFTVEAPDRLRVTAPPGGAIAPPGEYMLFVIDAGGRPCAYASFVRVGPDDGSRYAAIWVGHSGPAFVARHGLTSAQYQAEFDQHVGHDGMRLVDVSGYDVGGQAHYAAIWEKASGPPFVARHGLTSQEYQHEFDKQIGQGFRLILVDGYSVGGQDHYAAIFEKSPGPAFVARHGLTSAQYQQAFDDFVGRQGYRLKLVSAHKIRGQTSYAAIFEKSPGPSFVARHGLRSAEYQAEFDQHVGQDHMRLVWVNGS
jgi:hypothetical protein